MSQSSDDEVDDDSGKETKDDEGLNDFISVFILYACCLNPLQWQNSFNYATCFIIILLLGMQVHMYQYNVSPCLAIKCALCYLFMFVI